MVATDPCNMDQIQAGAPRPCLSCYGLCHRWGSIKYHRTSHSLCESFFSTLKFKKWNSNWLPQNRIFFNHPNAHPCAINHYFCLRIYASYTAKKLNRLKSNFSSNHTKHSKYSNEIPQRSWKVVFPNFAS